MPNSVQASTLPPGNKPRWSRAAAAIMCTAGPTSLDVLSVYHQLQRSPTHVMVTVRSVITAVSGVAHPVVTGWNASVITVVLPAQVNSAITQSGGG